MEMRQRLRFYGPLPSGNEKGKVWQVLLQYGDSVLGAGPTKAQACLNAAKTCNDLVETLVAMSGEQKDE